MPDPEHSDATALAAAIRTRQTTAVASLEAAAERADALASLGAVRATNMAAALDAAHAVDRAVADGSLPTGAVFAGVPFLMKDLGVRVAGFQTVSGSKALLRRAETSQSDDLLTARFRQSGLIIFGVTTAPEFGNNLVCEPAIGPVCRNPLDPERSPGGSSGGAASAVASGIVHMAHANDAAGSIRVPAACCGLVGLKPSRGAIPSGPDYDNYCLGLVGNLVVSQTLRDTAAVLSALSRDARPNTDLRLGDPTPLDDAPAALRIAVIDALPEDMPFDPERETAVLHAADVLQQAGHVLTRLDPDRILSLIRLASPATGKILCANLARTLDAMVPPLAPGELERMTEADLLFGRSVSGADIMDASIAMAKVSLGVADLFSDFDVLLTPMLSSAPPMIGSFPMDHADAASHARAHFGFAPYAGLANVAGIPALTVPHGVDRAGFPLPIQLMAPIGKDMLLLRLARVLQRAEPWRSVE